MQAALDETVGTLKRRAQIALGVRRVRTGRLLDSSGSVVDGFVPIKKARVQNGDSLTLLRTNGVQVQASFGAFAAILIDGSAAALCRISSIMCSRFKPQPVLLQRFLSMDPS